MNEIKIDHLISNYLKEEITPQEFEQLQQWVFSSEENRTEFEEILRGYKSAKITQYHKKSVTTELTKKSRKNRFLIGSVAAVFAVGFFVTATLYFYPTTKVTSVGNVKAVAKNIVYKAGEDDITIMAENKVIPVGDLVNSGVVNGAEVTNNSVNYSSIPASKIQKESVLTVLYVPKGKTFQLTLSDGTELHVNSDTRVEYPSYFSGTTRRIKVNGEVYISVTPDKSRPFIIDAENTEIKVLGTKFNLSAYPDADHITTTLKEGSVQVSFKDVSKIITPNEQLQFNKSTSRMDVSTVDVSKSIGWIDGVYSFDNMTLTDIAKLFNRVYGIEVTITNSEVMNRLFTGVVHRSIDYKEMFEILMKTTKIEYTIEKEKITIR